MRKQLVFAFEALTAVALASCASAGPQMVAEFSDVSDTKFHLTVVAPRDTVREYAVCKAVWLAEKKHVAQMSLSAPSYGPARSLGPVPEKIPDSWVSLATTAYLNAPSPDGGPMFGVAQKARMCREAWDWYR